MSIFEKATRLKLRFPTTKGLISVEDVWDLPLTSQQKVSLDSLARDTNRELRETQEESFVKPTPANDKLQLRMDILKHVIKVRMDENQAKQDALAKEQKKAKLKELIQRKKDEALDSLSLDELEKQLADL